MARFGYPLVLIALGFVSCSGESALPDFPVPPAPELQSGSAPLVVPVPGESVQNALQVLRHDVWTLLTVQEYQGFVAAFAFFFGLFALFDGLRLFRMVVVASFAIVGFIVALSQLQNVWQGHELIAKYAAAFEVALFVVFAAYKGWDGAQLILGTIFGLYLFRTEQDLAALAGFASASQQSQWMVVVGTACVALGVAMVHDRYGGKRFIGMFASLLGASLVVSAIGFFSMKVCSLPSPPIHVHIKPEQVASVYEFWYMMVLPMESEPVGLFTVSGKNVSLGSHRLDWDRVLCFFCWMLFFVAGTRFQMKAAAAASADSSNSLKTRLLDVEGQVIAVETTGDVGFEGQILKIEGDRRRGIEPRVIKIES